MRRYFKVLLILSTILFFGVTTPVMAKSYEISNYDINLTLEEAGAFLITERITYNFKKGNFTWASRNIKNRGFDNLEFISIEGIDTGINDYEVSNDNELDVKWYFPKSTGNKSFLLPYRANGGLITSPELS